MSGFGIIIPAHNEQNCIQACLDSLKPFFLAGDEIVVMDAGSTDETANIAVQAGVRVIQLSSNKRGLAIASGVKFFQEFKRRIDFLIIAHADMIFSPNARQVLLKAMENHPDSPGGCYGHRINAKGLQYRVVEMGNKFRASILNMPYGDQAQFFRPEVLEAAGGFPEMEWLEDVELSLRLRQIGPMKYLNYPVTIPSRHWEKGVIRTTLSNWSTVLQYLFKRLKK